MFMGTGSDVGKSLIVAGLCRALSNRGMSVAPFKPQNMSNNAAVTMDGGEIGRAQALQARAARRDPITAMNPVLLKPEHDTGAQVILRGQRVASMPAIEYWARRGEYLAPVCDAFRELAATTDMVLVEGAGSASEINLRHNDIANFGFARAMNAPVALLGDISRGGVIASLAGTFNVIDPRDAALIHATIVNRFHGETSLFEPGRHQIEVLTGVPCFGPVPFFAGAARLPAEDALALDAVSEAGDGKVKIAVLRLPRIANFDDFDPLRAEPDVELVLVQPGQSVPRDARLIIIPGSKATRADLDALRAEGWDIDIRAHTRAGGAVLGVCGGYQMLGRTIADPDGIEGAPGTSEGLGLLQVDTVLGTRKALEVEDGMDAVSGAQLTGYHMHMGVTSGPDAQGPFAAMSGRLDGARSSNGRIMGTYLHGLFAADAFRRMFLNQLGAVSSTALNYEAEIELALDALAGHLETHLDIDALLVLAGEVE
jgi:adenosylcobyric acid synthase